MINYKRLESGNIFGKRVVDYRLKEFYIPVFTSGIYQSGVALLMITL